MLEKISFTPTPFVLHPPPRVKITCADHHNPVFLTHTDLTRLEEQDREKEEVEMAAGVKKKVWCWNCLVMVGSIFKHTSPFSIFSLQLLQIDRELLAFSIMYSPVFLSSSPAASTFGLSSLSGTMSCTTCSSVPSPPSNKVQFHPSLVETWDSKRESWNPGEVESSKWVLWLWH